MRYAALVALAVVLATGCWRNRPKATPVAAAPAAAAPVAVASAEPLSVPQTAVRLPPPQPIPPEALPPEEPVATPAPGPLETAPTPPRPGPKSKPAASPLPPPAPAPAATTAPANAEPQLRPLFTPEQARQLNRQIDDSLAAAQRRLNQAKPRTPDRDRSAAIERVQAFIGQAQQARQQGDLNRARRMAERAAALAADLVKSAK